MGGGQTPCVNVNLPRNIINLTCLFMDTHDTQPATPSVGNYEIRLPKHKRPGEPERYQLSASRIGSTLREPPTKPVVSR